MCLPLNESNIAVRKGYKDTDKEKDKDKVMGIIKKKKGYG